MSNTTTEFFPLFLLDGGEWKEIGEEKRPKNLRDHHEIKLYDDNMKFKGMGYYRKEDRPYGNTVDQVIDTLRKFKKDKR